MRDGLGRRQAQVDGDTPAVVVVGAEAAPIGQNRVSSDGFSAPVQGK